MKITIGGTAGSGKNTVAEILAKKLHLKVYDVGQMRRQLAERMKLSLAELNKLGEREEFTDKEIDRQQEQIGKGEDNFIMVGRMAYHFIPDSIKIFLTASPKEAGRRIYQSQKNRTAERFKSAAEATKETLEREASDRKRYKKWYDLDPHDPTQFDLVIDSTDFPAELVAKKILEYIKRLK